MFNNNFRSIPDLGRFGSATLLKRQCVAEHSWFVSLYASQIAEYMGLRDAARLEVLEYAIRHDLDERWSTDIPGPAKREIVDKEKHARHKTRALQVFGDPVCDSMAQGEFASEQTRDIVKCADLVDEVFYLQRELLMGNQLVKQYIANSQHRLQQAFEQLGEPHLYFKVMDQLAEWETAGTGVIINDSDLRQPLDTDIPF